MKNGDRTGGRYVKLTKSSGLDNSQSSDGFWYNLFNTHWMKSILHSPLVQKGFSGLEVLSPLSLLYPLLLLTCPFLYSFFVLTSFLVLRFMISCILWYPPKWQWLGVKVDPKACYCTIFIGDLTNVAFLWLWVVMLLVCDCTLGQHQVFCCFCVQLLFCKLQNLNKMMHIRVHRDPFESLALFWLAFHFIIKRERNGQLPTHI